MSDPMRTCRPKVFDMPSFDGAPRYRPIDSQDNPWRTAPEFVAVEMRDDFQVSAPQTFRDETKRELAYRLAFETRSFSVTFSDKSDEPADDTIRFHKKGHVKMNAKAEEDAIADLKVKLAGVRQKKVASEGGTLRGLKGWYVCRRDNGELFGLSLDERAKWFTRIGG